jgi:hypothetical protein
VCKKPCFRGVAWWWGRKIPKPTPLRIDVKNAMQ